MYENFKRKNNKSILYFLLGSGLSISSSPIFYKKLASSKIKFDEDLMVSTSRP